MTGPDPNSIYPNENIRQVVYIKTSFPGRISLSGITRITTT